MCRNWVILKRPLLFGGFFSFFSASPLCIIYRRYRNVHFSLANDSAARSRQRLLTRAPPTNDGMRAVVNNFGTSDFTLKFAIWKNNERLFSNHTKITISVLYQSYLVFKNQNEGEAVVKPSRYATLDWLFGKVPQVLHWKYGHGEVLVSLQEFTCHCSDTM